MIMLEGNGYLEEKTSTKDVFSIANHNKKEGGGLCGKLKILG